MCAFHFRIIRNSDNNIQRSRYIDWKHISCRIFEYLPRQWTPAKNQPISRLTRQGDRAEQLLFTLLSQFCSNEFDLFNEFFLKWMSNLSSLTLITCKLTPSSSDLVTAMATASKLLFTMRPLHVWGRSFASFHSEVSSVTNPLIGQEIDKQPIKRQVSYDDSKSSQ